MADSFVGEGKVVSVVTVDQKTPMGSEIVEVTFEGGRIRTMPKKAYELVVTDIASDASIVRRTKFNAMVPAIIALICEYDVEVANAQSLLHEVAGSIDNSFARATNYLWTKDDRQYVPGGNPMFDRTLLEADALIKSIPDTVEAPLPPQTDGPGT